MSKLSKLITFDNIEVFTKACKNFGNKAADCNLCVHACPVQAIKLIDKIPTIQHSKCIDCGACVSECPVLAIDHIQKPYTGIVDQMKLYPDSKITCGEYEEYQKGIKIPCYLYIDLPTLLYYGKGKEKIILHTEKCKGCSKSDYISIAAHLNQLQKELKDSNVSLELAESKEPLIEQEQDQVINGMTRRDLLKNLSFKRLRKLIVEEEEEHSEIKKMMLSIKERMLYKKSLYYEAFAEGKFTNEQAFPSKKHSYFVSLKEECTGCSICTQVCPTAALYWQNNGNKSDLMFSTKACVDCKKCIACPEHAISVKEFTQNQDESHMLKKLASFSLRSCESCGEEFRTKGDEELCNFCGSKVNKDPSRFFA